METRKISDIPRIATVPFDRSMGCASVENLSIGVLFE
jgi:hypothetical protein